MPRASHDPGLDTQRNAPPGQEPGPGAPGGAAHGPGGADLASALVVLAESEARLRRATSAARCATFEIEDPGQGDGLRVSPGFCELLGLPPEAPCDVATIPGRIHS